MTFIYVLHWAFITETYRWGQLGPRCVVCVALLYCLPMQILSHCLLKQYMSQGIKMTSFIHCHKFTTIKCAMSWYANP